MFDLYFNSENLFVESLELISKKKNDFSVPLNCGYYSIFSSETIIIIIFNERIFKPSIL